MFTSGPGGITFLWMLPVPFEMVSHASFELQIADWTDIKLQKGIIGGLCFQRQLLGHLPLTSFLTFKCQSNGFIRLGRA